MQEQKVQLELLKGRRTSYEEQVAAARATLRQLGATPEAPSGAAAERVASLEARLNELLENRANAEQAVRCAPRPCENVRYCIGHNPLASDCTNPYRY